MHVRNSTTNYTVDFFGSFCICFSTICSNYCFCSSWVISTVLSDWITATLHSTAPFTTFTVGIWLWAFSHPVLGWCLRNVFRISKATNSFMVFMVNKNWQKFLKKKHCIELNARQGCWSMQSQSTAATISHHPIHSTLGADDQKVAARLVK